MVDLRHYDGFYGGDPEDLRTFGYEVAGVVDAVGAGVTGFAVGDEVIASDIPRNGCAEQVIVPASGLLAKPATAGPANHDYLKSLGAEPVAYGDGLHRGGSGDLARTRARPRPRAHHPCVLPSAGARHPPDRQRSRRRPGIEVRQVGRVEALRLLAEGAIDFPVIGTYPLAATADAHCDTLTRHSRGKIVVVP